MKAAKNFRCVEAKRDLEDREEPLFREGLIENSAQVSEAPCAPGSRPVLFHRISGLASCVRSGDIPSTRHSEL